MPTAGGPEELAAHQGLGEGGSDQGDPLTAAWKAGPGQVLRGRWSDRKVSCFIILWLFSRTMGRRW